MSSRGRVVRAQIDVIAQIRHLPIERRRVGHHAQRIVVDLQLAAGVFEHGALPVGVVNDVVERRDEVDVLQRHVADPNAASRRDGFLHGGAVAQQIERKLPRRQRFVDVRGIDGLVLGVARHIENADGQSFLVQPVRYLRHVEGIGADHRVLGLPADAGVACRTWCP